MLREMKIVPSASPKYKDWLMITTDEPKIYFIPSFEFVNLIIEAGRRFNTLAPIAPYENLPLLGQVWKTNNTIYEWFLKKLKKIQPKYEHLLHE